MADVGIAQSAVWFPEAGKHNVTWLDVIVPTETETLTIPLPAKLEGSNRLTWSSPGDPAGPA